MLDVQFLRDHPDRVRQAIRDKAIGDPSLVDRALDLDTRRRAILTETQAAQGEANATAKAIGALMQAGQRDEAEAKRAESAALKGRVKALEDEARTVEADFERAMLELPNLPHSSVPVGASEADNQTVYEHGEPPAFSFEPKPHWELLAQHGLVDFERGVKVTGAGFPFYVGMGARLQRALVQFFLDEAGVAGYIEIQPPLLVNRDSATGTGQLPDKEGQMYQLGEFSDGFPFVLDASTPAGYQQAEQLWELDKGIRSKSEDDAYEDHLEEAVKGFIATGHYLIPTAEVPVTNFFRGELLNEADLPTKFAAHTPCFRREAGSYGKDVRGLNRLHQFDKVELVQFVHPDASYDALEALRADAERLLHLLELPYRRLLMCTADMGFTQAKKYDLEVWSAGQGRWLEVSSVSNFEAFQARRANIRFRPVGGGKPAFVHTLNGSGLALPRIVAALIEQGQQADGSIVLPAVLHRYGVERIG